MFQYRLVIGLIGKKIRCHKVLVATFANIADPDQTILYEHSRTGQHYCHINTIFLTPFSGKALNYVTRIKISQTKRKKKEKKCFLKENTILILGL